MKSNIVYLILILTTIFGQNIFGQISDGLKSYESNDGKLIQLLTNNRVLIEETEKVEYPDSTNIISITNDGKKICGLRIGYVTEHSYGTYELTDSNLILNFRDENPIEKIAVSYSDKQKTIDKITINIVKEIEYSNLDLIIKQKENIVCVIPSFANEWDFTIENILEPLIFEYNNNFKKLKLSSNSDVEIHIKTNDLKTNNKIRNQTIVYELKNLTENN